MQKLKLLSWNVNGIRAAEKKGFLDWLADISPDILFVQETKVQDEMVLSEGLRAPEGYEVYWHGAQEKKGYSGTALFTKEKPLNVKTNFGKNLLSSEGRIIEAEYKDFIILGVYFPNGGMSEERLQFKLTFYDQFLKYIKKRTKDKPVIFCGDVNTAHNEIDLARPKENEKNTGFLPIERKWMDDVAASGFVDTFRAQHPDAKDEYSWWDMKTRARDRNVGWRIDYFFADKKLEKNIKEAFIWQEVLGSDHCPVGIIFSKK